MPPPAPIQNVGSTSSAATGEASVAAHRNASSERSTVRERRASLIGAGYPAPGPVSKEARPWQEGGNLGHPASASSRCSPPPHGRGAPRQALDLRSAGEELLRRGARRGSLRALPWQASRESPRPGGRSAVADGAEPRALLARWISNP